MERPPSPPHHRLPLNLPHAATVADRIVTVLTRSAKRDDPGHAPLFTQAEALRELLAPCRFLESNPPPPEAARLQTAAADQARALVADIARLHLGSDRLGQCIRNLFECLELGREGVELSLTAGENPRSVQRPHARRLPTLGTDGAPVAPPPSPPSAPEPPRPTEHERLAPIDPTGRPVFEPPAPKPPKPRRKLGRELDSAGRVPAAPGAAPTLPPPAELTPPSADELGPPLDEADFAGLPPAPAVPAEPTPPPQTRPHPAPPAADLEPADLGPPLEDDGSFEPPTRQGGRQTGGIIDDKDDGGDWTFDE